jgi:polyisoprenoid-binding protein YceI
MIGCAGAGQTGAPTTGAQPSAVPATAAPATVPPAAQETATSAPTESAEPTNTSAAATPAAGAEPTVVPVTLVVVPEESEARYRVREQLAGVSLPSDAIGRTNAVTGTIVGRTDGTLVPEESNFVVDLRTLRSDQGMRDNFLRRNTLETDQYPLATFVPTSAPGLPLEIPPAAESSFQLVGDLTIRDVTKEVTWDATCQLESNLIDGSCQATTSFTFAEMGLTVPRVARVLSIEDKITLEVDLTFKRISP